MTLNISNKNNKINNVYFNNKSIIKDKYNKLYIYKDNLHQDEVIKTLLLQKNSIDQLIKACSKLSFAKNKL